MVSDRKGDLPWRQAPLTVTDAERSYIISVMTMGERIRRARQDAGFKTLTALSERLGVSRQTIANWEKNRHPPTPENWADLVTALDVSEPWLRFGIASEPLKAVDKYGGNHTELMPVNVSVIIGEVDLGPLRAIKYGPVDVRRGDIVVNYWQLPKNLLAGHTDARPEDVKIIIMDSEEMSPVIARGSRLLVDLTDKSPSRGGIFLLLDGDAYEVRHVNRVMATRPIQVRVSAESPRVPARELPLADLHIEGRVIAEWRWL